MRLLIVEDSETQMMLLRASLETIFASLSEKTEIRTATKMEEALRISEEWKPELILLDLNLSDSVDEDTVGRIALFSGGPAVIVITANDTSEMALRCSRAGCDTFIHKSALTTLERLCSVVTGALRRRMYPPLYARKQGGAQ